MKYWLILSIFLAGHSCAAEDNEAIDWLKKMAASNNNVSYVGTFIYQHGGRLETSHLTHHVSPMGDVFEKLETLDGPPREIIRANDKVTAYLPDSQTVIVEKRNPHHLPVTLPENLQELNAQYELKKTHSERIVGFECQWIFIAPKDKLRYGRKFCIEFNTGLPLRAQVVNEKMEVIESFGFYQLQIDQDVAAESQDSLYAVVARNENWRIDRSALNITEKPFDTGWTIKPSPPGFYKKMEVKRTVAGRLSAIPHLVYSDGLAAISVFIEPNQRKKMTPPLISKGAIHIYKKNYQTFTIVVLGEVPAKTVMMFANSVQYKKSSEH